MHSTHYKINLKIMAVVYDGLVKPIADYLVYLKPVDAHDNHFFVPPDLHVIHTFWFTVASLSFILGIIIIIIFIVVFDLC